MCPDWRRNEVGEEAARRLLPGAFAEAGLLWAATVIALDARAPAGLPDSVLVGLALLTRCPSPPTARSLPTFREEHLFAPSAFDRYLARVDPRADSGRFDEQPYPRTVGAAGVRRPLRRQRLGLRAALLDLLHPRPLGARNRLQPRYRRRGPLAPGEPSLRSRTRRRSTATRQPSSVRSALEWGVRLRDQRAIAGYRRIRGNALVDWDEHEAPYPDVRLARTLARGEWCRSTR